VSANDVFAVVVLAIPGLLALAFLVRELFSRNSPSGIRNRVVRSALCGVTSTTFLFFVLMAGIVAERTVQGLHWDTALVFFSCIALPFGLVVAVGMFTQATVWALLDRAFNKKGNLK